MFENHSKRLTLHNCEVSEATIVCVIEPRVGEEVSITKLFVARFAHNVEK